MSQRCAIIYGGAGALGAAVVSKFVGDQWHVISIDTKKNDTANNSVTVDKHKDFVKQAEEVISGTEAALSGRKADAVLCFAGGWQGGNARSKRFIESCDLSMKQSLWTSLIACRLAAMFLSEKGLVVFTSATSALDHTPGMIGYGVAKAAVLHLTRSVASSKGGLPQVATAVAILPAMLDTEANRRSMPGSDVSSWTPLPFVADLIFDWAAERVPRPKSGSLIQLLTADGATKVEPCNE